MSWLVPTAIASLSGLVGVTITHLYHRRRIGSHHRLAQEILQEAEIEAEKLRKESELAIRQAELAHSKELDEQRDKSKQRLRKEEERLAERQELIEKRLEQLERRRIELEQRDQTLIQDANKIDSQRHELEKNQEELTQQLEKAAHLNRAEAQELLLQKTVTLVSDDMAKRTRYLIEEAEEEANYRARKIITTAINRVATSQVSDATVSTVALPNEEMKGRIVGREGRNIRALEQATGVNFILDESPEMVIIAGFDPLRKQVAKLALKELVLDGRIHPSRIEETVEKARQGLTEAIHKAGQDAAQKAWCPDLHKELIILLGHLSLRLSCGQNLLDHSLEVSHLLGIMAEELNLDARLARRIGLLHDIGKAVSHEMEGTHALIGYDLALKYGESEKVANGIGCHHGEIDPITIEGSLCGAADTISAARPGARVEAVSDYIKRLRRLEEIAFEFPAVEQAYALQAGRELRIVVLPDMIDDAGATNLARDVTHCIQQRVRYSGKIQVTVIREKRVVNYAV